jgi:hypothetical protein
VDDLAMDVGAVLNDGAGGATATGTVTITNEGTTDLTVTGVSLATGTAFAISGFPATPFVLAPAATQDVTVTFDPTALGALSDTLTVLSDDLDEGSVPVALSGQGYAAESWQSGNAVVTIVDMWGDVDVDPDDISVRFGWDNSIRSIRLAGALSMDGVGIVISGATRVGRIRDARTGPIGELAFIACDSPVGRLHVNGAVAGYNLNGLSLGGIDFDPDIDGDGDTSDLTALYVAGGLKRATFSGLVSGDVVIDGPVGRLRIGESLLGDVEVGGAANRIRVAGSLLGNVHVHGNLRKAVVVGDLGTQAGTFQVDGSLSVLALGARTAPTDVLAGLMVGGNAGRLRLGYIGNSLTIAGDLTKLTTTSTLAPGTAPVDFQCLNPDPMTDGELIVTGNVGRVRGA